MTFLPQQPHFLCGGKKLELAHPKLFQDMQKTLSTLPAGNKEAKKLYQGIVALPGVLKIKTNEHLPAVLVNMHQCHAIQLCGFNLTVDRSGTRP